MMKILWGDAFEKMDKQAENRTALVRRRFQGRGSSF
jgi:hypothetical protein